MLLDGNTIVPQYEQGESDEKVLVALAMAAYEMSVAIDTDDPDELFPSRGFLVPEDIRPFMSYKAHGHQVVMDLAFERQIMLDVRPARYYDPENGPEDAFVLNVRKFGDDRCRGRTPALLVERANAIVPDVIDGFARLRGQIDRIFGKEERTTIMPPPTPADVFDHEDVGSDRQEAHVAPSMGTSPVDDIEIEVVGGDPPLDLLHDDEVWAVPDDHELDVATEDIVAEGAMLFANVNVHWRLGDDDVVEPVEEPVPDDGIA